MKRYLIITIFGLLFFGCEKVADINPASDGLFIKYYGNADRSEKLEAGNMVVTESEIVVVGTILNEDDLNRDIYLFKTNDIGRLQTETNINIIDTLFTEDYGVDIKAATGGGYYVLGQMNKPTGEKDMVVLKVDDNLNLEWTDILVDPLGRTEKEEARALYVQEDGGLAILGDYLDNAGDRWSFIYVYYHDDPSASFYTDPPYGSVEAKYEAGRAIMQDDLSGYAFAYTPRIFGGTSEPKATLALTDPAGDVYDAEDYGESTESVDLIRFGGQYVLLGNNMTGDQSESISLFRIESTDLTKFEEINITGAGNLEGRGLGYSSEYILITGSIVDGTTTDICLIKTDPNGKAVWEDEIKTYGGDGNDYGVSVAAVEDGYIILGIAQVAGLKMITLMKTDLEGNLISN